MTRLSQSFTLEEAVFSQTAARMGIDNNPSSDILDNMKAAAAKLQLVRDHLGVPITVSSWYRGPTLNAAIPGSSKVSAHMEGWAVDCKVTGMTPYDVCQKTLTFLKDNNVAFDQMIHEFGSWMHISFEPKGRGQLLTIFAGGGYKPGILTQDQYKHA